MLLTPESVWLPTSTVSLHMDMVWPPGNVESNVFSSHGYGNSHPHWGTPLFRGKKVPPLSAVFMARSVKTILLHQCFKGFREDVGIINMPFYGSQQLSYVSNDLHCLPRMQFQFSWQDLYLRLSTKLSMPGIDFFPSRWKGLKHL